MKTVERGGGQPASWRIVEVEYQSPLYEAVLAFREAHLRRPLGLALTAEDVAGEDHQIHFAALEGGRVVGSITLRPVSDTLVKLRQMAVAPEMRGSGLARALVEWAEACALRSGFREIDMAARVRAMTFYERMGYRASGDVFEEVTIPHRRMTKRFSP